MKSKLIIFVFLILFLPVTAMSGDSSEIDPKMEKYKLTQEELHNIAINYYKFMFEEEHEFKGMFRKDNEGIIKNITPFKADTLTLFYMVNFNPDGHVLIKAHKNLGSPIDQNGDGAWTFGVKEGYFSITDKRLTPFHLDYYNRLLEAFKNRKILTNDKEIKSWEKFNVPTDSFHEKANFDKSIPQPDWWIKKKALKQQNQ
ncbi:MAG: hypothetical protein JXR69_09820 [Candidatus Delongbacteria bacterium]|nr:hypothetical protein [Candidatus Delongbacteria bacterium]